MFRCQCDLNLRKLFIVFSELQCLIKSNIKSNGLDAPGKQSE